MRMQSFILSSRFAILSFRVAMAGPFSQHSKTEIEFMPEFAMKLAVLSLKGNEGYLPLAACSFQTSLENVLQRER